MKAFVFPRLLPGIIPLCTFLAFTSCKEEEGGGTPLQDGIFLGEKADIGQGKAQTYPTRPHL